ncbi:hypothetical protein HFO56_01445 [Rhizobium laguerreae]|uniref:hypothetical protein n=1 Tax=Rhizobium laguerreae TaxID=1076926 RepID=UPI001C92404A|nr:hypothetical protein [Rhizobium laguerreae]MBY3151074.1 hypothetical protein [Rhizobium laguerreae]
MAVEYRINLRLVAHELKDGDLVLVGLDKYRWVGEHYTAATALGRVVKGGNDNVEIEVADLGVLQGQRPGGYSTNLNVRYPVKEIDVHAVNKLRTDDREVVYQYLDRVKGVDRLKSVAVHVISVDENGIAGRLIGESGLSLEHDPDEFKLADADQGSIEIVRQGAAEVTGVFTVKLKNMPKSLDKEKALPEVAVGDILVARHFGFKFEDGTPFVHLTDVAVVGNAETTAAAVAFLGLDKLPANRDHSFASALSGASEITHDYETAHSRTEPSTALVLFYKDGDEMTHHTLGASGYYAFVEPEIDSYFNDKVSEPGLWTVHNMAIRGYQSHEGEWDADLEGDWLAATMEDVERLFGLEAIDDEIAAVLGTGEEPAGLAEKYMEIARQAVIEEAFDTEHMVFARHRLGLLSDRTVAEEDILNEAALDDFLAEHTAALEPEVLRTQLIGAMKKDVLDRSRLFEAVTPTEEEAETFEARKTWRKDRAPVVFVPDEALVRDIATVVSTVSAKVPALMKTIEGGANYSRSSIRYLMGKLAQPMSSDGLKPFSKARHTDGEWYFVTKHKRDVTLGLFIDGIHAATLVSSGEQSRLLSWNGLEMTKSWSFTDETLPPLRRHVSVDDKLRDADRAIAELDARREVYGDYFHPVEDGVHEVHTSTIHTADGVMHRVDGPALVRGPRFVGDLAYEEYRFRGNLHRDDGPAIVEGDQAVWYRHGLEHRTDGPSAIIGPEREYRQYDRLHRDGDPAIESVGLTAWYRHGRVHREDGPALIYRDAKHYYRGGLLHRAGEPAIETDHGLDAYYQNGRLHNPDGPAAMYSDETVYAINGERMTYAEHRDRAAAMSASTGPTM